eukprot:SAG11_NODE_13476_length_653_cov_4.566787_1_plen_107_part_00
MVLTREKSGLLLEREPIWCMRLDVVHHLRRHRILGSECHTNLVKNVCSGGGELRRDLRVPWAKCVVPPRLLASHAFEPYIYIAAAAYIYLGSGGSIYIYSGGGIYI